MQPKNEDQIIHSSDLSKKRAEENRIEKKVEYSETSPPSSFGGNNFKAKLDYETSLLAWLERYKHYPSIARRNGYEGFIEIEFIIDKDGNVLSQNILKSSKFNILNKAAEKMIKRASPLPPIPEAIRFNEDSFRFVVPVSFTLD